MYTDVTELEKRMASKRNQTFPLTVAIEPGNYCNLNCITCTNNQIKRKRGNMNVLLYKKIIDEIAEENPYTRIWLDYYGEPLLQKFKLYYFIDYAKKKGIKNICINTNGTLLDEEMAEMLLDSGIDFISIDCDGFSAEVYEKIRVNAKRDVVYKNIEYLLERKKFYQNKKGIDVPIIEVKVMEMQENKHEIQKIMDYWRMKGAWTTKRRLISWGGVLKDLEPDADINRVACANGIGILAITWDGLVTNCVMDVDAEYTCGDVNVQSIKEIWQKRNEDLVRKHFEHDWDNLPEICKNCNDWKIAGEERFDENGNPVNKSYENNEAMLKNDY